MKKFIFKSLACICLLSLAFSCSTDNDVEMQPENSRAEGFNAKNGSIWDAQIAIENPDGSYTFTVDERALIAEFQNILVQEGNTTKLQTISIQTRRATNMPSDFSSMLIASGSFQDGSSSTSIGTILVNSGGKYYIGAPGGKPRKSVSCTGCPTGCFLEYYNIDGHKVPYCDSAGCGPICEKSESRLF